MNVFTVSLVCCESLFNATLWYALIQILCTTIHYHKCVIGTCYITLSYTNVQPSSKGFTLLIITDYLHFLSHSLALEMAMSVQHFASR